MLDKKSTHKEEKIAGLRTRHVFLDTEVYRAHGHGFAHASMRTLANYISDDLLILHSTDINLAEIKRQLHEFSTKLARDAQNLSGRFLHWKEKAPKILKGNVPDIDAETLAEELYEVFHLELRLTHQAKIHNALNLPAKEVFERYFKRTAPFNDGKKEFPDAFMIEVLEKWCRENDVTMYIVTKDGPMQRAADQSDVLYSIKKIDDLFDLVTAEAPSELIEHINQLLDSKALLYELESYVSDHIGWVGFIYDGSLTEGEASDVSVSDEITINDFSLLSFSDDKIEIMVDLFVPLSAEIQFEDYSSASYDREDGIYFGVESGETTIEDNPIIRVFVSIDPSSDKVVDMELVTQDVCISEAYEEFY